MGRWIRHEATFLIGSFTIYFQYEISEDLPVGHNEKMASEVKCRCYFLLETFHMRFSNHQILDKIGVCLPLQKPEISYLLLS